MKTMYIGNGNNIIVDKEKDEISHIDPSREAISRIYKIDEDMTILIDRGEKKYTLNAKSGDILVVFYEDTFEHPAVLINSKEWNENINDYNAKQQAKKEAWAKAKAEEDAAKNSKYTPTEEVSGDAVADGK